MSNVVLETLSEVAQEVLRVAAFAFGDACPAAELPRPEASVLARLQFRGPCSGELLLAASLELCGELAADALSAAADEVGVEQAEDSLKELLNVIAGNWLTSVYGCEVVFALSAPSAEEIDAAEWEMLQRDAASAGLLIDERPLLVIARVTATGDV